MKIPRIATLLLSLFFLSGSCFGAPPEVPREVKAKVGQLTRVVVKSAAEVGMLRSFSDEEAFFDELVGKPGERRFVFQSNTQGRYVVGFWTKGEVEGVSCVIVVGDPGPVPPPDPPDPPSPDDPIFFRLKTAFMRDSGSVDHAKRLAAIYRQAASWVATEASIETDAALLAKMKQAADLSIGNSPLDTVRRVLADESNAKMKPTNLTRLSAERRKEWSQLFSRYASMLEVLK